MNIAVSAGGNDAIYNDPPLFNYITSPDVLIRSAAACSCCLPGIFKPLPLLVKSKASSPIISIDKGIEEMASDPILNASPSLTSSSIVSSSNLPHPIPPLVEWNEREDRWVDGSLVNDIPLSRIVELFNVHSVIVSQVNIHVWPFLSGKSLWIQRLKGHLLYLIKSEISYRLKQIKLYGFFPSLIHRLERIIDQKYEGNITIIPEMYTSDLVNFINILSQRRVEELMERGKRAIWPKIESIRLNMMIEKKIENILDQLDK